MSTLKIGMGNGHNEHSLVELIEKSDCDSFGAHEAQTLLPGLRKIKNTRLTVAGADWAEKRNRARETAIVTNASLDNIGEFTRLVSEKVPKAERVAPDRVLVTSMYEHRLAHRLGFDGIAHMALHPDAAPNALRRGPMTNAIVREYHESLMSTVLMMRAFRKDGLLPFLTGDLQLPEDVVNPWSPQQIFVLGMGMGSIVHGIDWIIHPPEVKPVRSSVTVHKLFDHVGITAKFQEK